MTLFLFLVMNHEIYLSLMRSSTNNGFKLTEGAINITFTEHQLQKFVISRDCLKICEILGEGKLRLYAVKMF